MPLLTIDKAIKEIQEGLIEIDDSVDDSDSDE